MPTVLITKHSTTASAVPTLGDLEVGELAVNVIDQKIYSNNGTAIVEVSGIIPDDLSITSLTTSGSVTGADATFTNPITVGAPVDGTDATTKTYVDAVDTAIRAYVDSEILGLTVASPSNVALQLVGGGTLTAGRVNQLTDSLTYTLPLANSVPTNTFLIVEKSTVHQTEIPIVNTSGADTITYSGGTDTSLQFDQSTSTSLRLVSNGTDTWSL